MELLNKEPGVARWQVRTVGREGFELGLDEVTPVSWKLVLSKSVGDALYSFSLPDPDTEAYRDWLQAHRGTVLIASIRELRCTIQGLRAPNAAPERVSPPRF